MKARNVSLKETIPRSPASTPKDRDRPDQSEKKKHHPIRKKKIDEKISILTKCHVEDDAYAVHGTAIATRERGRAPPALVF